MSIAILGFGQEGKSVLKFLQNRRLTLMNPREPASKEIWILDQNRNIKIPKGIRSRLGKNCLKNLSDFDLVFRSPGIPYNLPELRRARKRGVTFSSATKLFFEAIRALHVTRYTLTVIGITGTKGKGTTATILYSILKNAGKNVFIAGNIGTPALDILPAIESRITNHKLRKSAFIILELSSFQLQDLEISPPIAVVTNVFPDHQDSHKNLAEYYGAKTNIARYQKRGDAIFYFARNKLSRWIAEKSPGKKISVNPHVSHSRELDNGIKKAIRIPGEHNFKNAVMAAEVASHLGVSARTILKTVKKFKGNEHRLEFFRKIGAVEFYNDSASTNPHTTAAAIKAFPGEPKILIAGGQDKNLDYAPLARALKNSNTKLVILFGENKNKIAKAIKRQGTSGKGQARIKFTKNLKDAVHYAYHSTTNHDPRPMTHILFSPGSASFDMFKNYAERGEQFKKIVQGLTKR